MASCAVPGSTTIELRGRGSGIADAGAIRMSTSPFGPDLVLVDVGLGLRAGTPPHRALAERRAEGHAQVGAVAAVPDQAVRVHVVEDAEQVVHVGVVDQELAVLVLEREELRVEGVGLLDDPLEGQRRQAGHPPVALRQVDVALGDPGRLPHDVERRRLCLQPGVERRVEPVVLHGGDATRVGTEFPVPVPTR